MDSILKNMESAKLFAEYYVRSLNLQIHWDFKLSPVQYVHQGREKITFPLLLECPACRARVRLYRHGFYPRNILIGQDDFKIDICRYLCRSCGVTVSLLPSFLLRHFQRCRDSLLQTLRTYLTSGHNSIGRQMLAFYLTRFRRNMNALVFKLRELGLLLKIPDDENEKAIKLITLLLDTLPGDPNSTGPKIHINFMALSL